MTQPATNAQVALQCALGTYAQIRVPSADAITTCADGYLRWLNANTPPPADQPGELG